MGSELSISDGLEKYWNSLITDIPFYVFLLLLCLLCMGIVIFTVWKGLMKSPHYILRLILAEYVFVILGFTVIYRNNEDPLKYDLHPFWSYFAIYYGEEYLLLQNIMNVVIFIPIGFLLVCGFSKWPWWKVFVSGFLFSMTIEVMQFAFKRGFCEIDDVIHNTLGCMIGYGLYIITTSLVRRHGFEK